MKDLVKIENQNGKLVVSSRVIAEQLSKDHQDVKKKIKEVLEIGTEYFPVQNTNRDKVVRCDCKVEDIVNATKVIKEVL